MSKFFKFFLCLEIVIVVIWQINYRSQSETKTLPPNVQLALERLAQFVQVALHTSSVYGSKRKLIFSEQFYYYFSILVTNLIFHLAEEFINRLKQLPQIRILRITLSRHKEII